MTNEMRSVALDCPNFYWKLFQSTFLISAFTVGGGFVIIPLLRAKYVDEYGWLDDKDTLNLVSIAQSMPGVVAVNASIILGYRMLARLAFEVARDEVRHSFDTGNPVITITGMRWPRLRMRRTSS